MVLSAGVGIVVALSVVAVLYALLAIPFIRDGLIRFALPAGVLVGTACGAVVGVWHARGGRLPTE